MRFSKIAERVLKTVLFVCFQSSSGGTRWSSRVWDVRSLCLVSMFFDILRNPLSASVSMVLTSPLLDPFAWHDGLLVNLAYPYTASDKSLVRFELEAL